MARPRRQPIERAARCRRRRRPRPRRPRRSVVNAKPGWRSSLRLPPGAVRQAPDAPAAVVARRSRSRSRPREIAAAIDEAARDRAVPPAWEYSATGSVMPAALQPVAGCSSGLPSVTPPAVVRAARGSPRAGSRPPPTRPARRRRSRDRPSCGRTRSATGCGAPYAQISGRDVGDACEWVRGRDRVRGRPTTSIRRIFPRRLAEILARCCSGRPRCRRLPCRRRDIRPGPNASCPPLWFANGCGIFRRTSRMPRPPRPVRETENREIVVSPLTSV